MRVVDYVCETLADHGVSAVFLVTGRGALFLTDGVAKSKRLRAVCTHHEQSASFAAVARGQLNNSVSACFVSTGCASTNAITGVLSAYQDGIPVVFVSGQNVLKETTAFTGLPLRTYGQQEANIVEIVKPITKYAAMLKDPADIRFLLEKALFLANDGKKGPVWIDIPLDLQSAQIEPDELRSFGNVHAITKQVSATDLSFLREKLSTAIRPVVLIGSGVRSADQCGALRRFVEENQLPVVYTPSSADVFPLSEELSIGSLGAMGCSRAGALAVQNSDCLLVLGNRLSSLTTGVDYCKFARGATIIVIDIDEVEHQKSELRIDRLIVQDLRSFFAGFGTARVTGDIAAWVGKCKYWKRRFCFEAFFSSTGPVDLYDLTRVLNRILDDDAVVVTDSGLIEVILPSNLDYGPNRRAIHPVSQGAMGFSVPAALGVADQGHQTVVVVGDGSIMMNLQELETIRAQKLPVKIVVINNNVYSIIRRRQKELFRNRTIGTDPENGVTVPSFERVANLFGFSFFKVQDVSGLERGLKSALSCEGPVICEVMGKEDQAYIEISHAKNSQGKFVRRPLEDQWPFLDREDFLSEMIIDPIDQ
ncbi:MAG: thiamine pyrophosphate-binding protein [Gammaproteobacteria bacterium]|nr:thiamine pyrophosphate-binding protein [Gammaproteobacteria bacterium]